MTTKRKTRTGAATAAPVKKAPAKPRRTRKVAPADLKRPGTAQTPPPAEAGQALAIPFREIQLSPLNPRTDAAAADIEPLAESIRDQGVLQNLVVRPGADGQGFELAAGERRLRAFGVLIKAGIRTENDKLPCLVRALTDAQLLEVALTQDNHGRALHPLDEAEGYLRLAQAGRTTEQIAATSPRGLRHVQLRLQLARNLGTAAKAAFREGVLDLARARELAAHADAATQKKVVPAIVKGEDYRYDSARELKRQLTQGLIPIGRNRFALDAYTAAGGKTVADSAGDEAYFADPTLFNKLQREWIAARLAELKGEGWKWVTSGKALERSWEYGESKDKQKAGVHLELRRDGGVEERIGLVKPEDVRAFRKADQAAARAQAQAQAKAEGKAPPPAELGAPCTKKGFELVKAQKQAALRRALQGKLAYSLAAVIVALWSNWQHAIKITRRDSTYYPDAAEFSDAADLLKKAFGASPKRDAHLLWGQLMALDPVDLEDLFGKIVALQVTVPWDRLEDDKIVTAMAASTDAHAYLVPEIDAELLQACSKPFLVDLGLRLEVTHPTKDREGLHILDRAALERLTKGNLIQAILRAADVLDPSKLGDWVPVPFRFAPAAELEKAWQAEAKAGPQKALQRELAAKAAKSPAAGEGPAPADVAGKVVKVPARKTAARKSAKPAAKKRGA